MAANRSGVASAAPRARATPSRWIKRRPRSSAETPGQARPARDQPPARRVECRRRALALRETISRKTTDGLSAFAVASTPVQRAGPPPPPPQRRRRGRRRRLRLSPRHRPQAARVRLLELEDERHTALRAPRRSAPLGEEALGRRVAVVRRIGPSDVAVVVGRRLRGAIGELRQRSEAARQLLGVLARSRWPPPHAPHRALGGAPRRRVSSRRRSRGLPRRARAASHVRAPRSDVRARRAATDRRRRRRRRAGVARSPRTEPRERHRQSKNQATDDGARVRFKREHRGGHRSTPPRDARRRAAVVAARRRPRATGRRSAATRAEGRAPDTPRNLSHIRCTTMVVKSARRRDEEDGAGSARGCQVLASRRARDVVLELPRSSAIAEDRDGGRGSQGGTDEIECVLLLDRRMQRQMLSAPSSSVAAAVATRGAASRRRAERRRGHPRTPAPPPRRGRRRIACLRALGAGDAVARTEVR